MESGRSSSRFLTTQKHLGGLLRKLPHRAAAGGVAYPEVHAAERHGRGHGERLDVRWDGHVAHDGMQRSGHSARVMEKVCASGIESLLGAPCG